MAIIRQVGVMIGIAASVALGVYVVMWARTPNYTLLFSDLSDRDVGQVVDALKSSDIDYRIDPSSGAILVAASRVHDARLNLAASGLPKGGGMGFELMEEDQGFGTSQFLERARYQRAMEGELSRSISRINNVRGARVHLGMPAQTVFSRAQREPSASVILDLYAGRRLEAHQVSAITHLVSASVPNLPTSKVTVVDQQGNLLTDQGGNEEVAITGRRFAHRQKVEESYIDRIESILVPFVGADGVRAQVTATMDFTATEQTRESFNPDLPALRSEQLVEEQRVGSGSGGVPGALSNEPPLEASAPEQIGNGPTAPGDEIASAQQPESKRMQSTRNYELDRTISHTKPSLGSIQRLSVAVVIRSRAVAEVPDAASAPADPAVPANPAAATGAVSAAEEQLVGGYTVAQLEEMTTIVKESIGFDPTRGDTVMVTSADFIVPVTPEALPDLPIWEQPWVWDVAKQALGAIFVLFLVFGVIRPTIKSLIVRPTTVAGNYAIAADGSVEALPSTLESQGANAFGAQEKRQSMLEGPELPRDVEGVREYVSKEPKVTAQVVRGWVGE